MRMSPERRDSRAEESSSGAGLKEALDALERLMKMFQVERVLYLVVSFFSFLLLIYSAVKLFNESQVNIGTMTAILGGSGLATVASARVALFLKRGFDLIELIVKKLNRIDP